jgi:hypothetical protein
MLLWYVRTAFFAALRTLSLGLNSKQALAWFCFAHIKQQIVSLFRSDLISAFLCKLVSECLLISYSPPEATLKLELHRVQNARSFPNKLECNQWCDFFHSSWNSQLYFFFFDVEEGVLGPEFHLLFVD